MSSISRPTLPVAPATATLNPMVFSADCVAHISEAERGGNTRSRTLPVYRMSIVDSEQRLPEAQLNGPVAAPHLVKPAWVEIQKPFRLFALNAPDWGRDLTYSAERHRDGGGRRDHLTFGKFGATAWLQITLYRPGMEEADPTPFFTDMARRAAPAGLAVARMGQPQQVPTRVGSFDVADFK